MVQDLGSGRKSMIGFRFFAFHGSN